MGRITMGVLMLIAFGFFLWATLNKDNPDYDKIRTVRVCALCSKTNPVSRDRIKKLFNVASEDFRRNVKLEFDVFEVKETTLDPLLPDPKSQDFRGECPGADIVAVFSN